MSDISVYVGERIRRIRKSQGMTLQELADRIHKSRATVSKYENGEIVIDIETLYEVSLALNVSFARLTDYHPPVPLSDAVQVPKRQLGSRSPFFKARRLYIYFLDGRTRRLKDGAIDIIEDDEQPGRYLARLTVATVSDSGRSADTFFEGTVTYSDMLIRFSFINQFNTLEEDLLYIFNPLAATDETTGLICGISSADLIPCAFKCLVTLSSQKHDEELSRKLLVDRKSWQHCQKLNMFAVNHVS